MKHKRTTVLAAAGCFLLLTLTGCGERLKAADIMELNRSGKWMEAKKASRQILEPYSEYTDSEICEIYFNLIYAEVRLGEKAKAAEHIEDLNWYIRRDGLPPEVIWIEREIAALKSELAGSPNSKGETDVSNG